jgi:hypothetical protein
MDYAGLTAYFQLLSGRLYCWAGTLAASLGPRVKLWGHLGSILTRQLNAWAGASLKSICANLLCWATALLFGGLSVEVDSVVAGLPLSPHFLGARISCSAPTLRLAAAGQPGAVIHQILHLAVTPLSEIWTRGLSAGHLSRVILGSYLNVFIRDLPWLPPITSCPSALGFLP